MKTVFLILLFSTFAHAQSIVGTWKTIDEKSLKEMAIVEIYKQNNKYFAKLTEILNVNKSHSSCPDCSAKIKNKSLLGKIIIKELELEKNKNQYSSGTLIDPFSDKQYSCVIKFIDKNKINVRAYSGFYLFGKSQTWIRF
jgi:uncharacterized protein (DUF2147 family)